MAKFEDGSYSTIYTNALIGKVLAGRCKMRYVRAAVGSGFLGEDDSPKTASEPAGYVMDAVIASVTNPVDGECMVTVQVNSSNVETGFFCTGVVLYAEDPDLGEVPYTYLTLEDGAEWIRPASAIVGKLATFELIAAVGAVDAVEAVIDPEAIMTVAAAKQLIAEHDADASAHMERLAQFLSSHNADLNAHPELMGQITTLINTAVASAQGGGVLIRDITIAAEDWTQLDEADNDCFWRVDAAVEDVTSEHVPLVFLSRDAMTAAKLARLSPTAETGEGVIQLWAKDQPSESLTCTIVLLTQKSEGSAGVYALPIATETTLGGVKIGNGLSVASDGTLSVNTETVMTAEDLVDENEVQESVATILNEDMA